MTISKIQRAQDEIAQILKRLEVDTGQSVSSIELRKIEILRIDKPDPEFVIGVAISLNRPSGQGWLVND
jgi:hypothetical protein